VRRATLQCGGSLTGRRQQRAASKQAQGRSQAASAVSPAAGLQGFGVPNRQQHLSLQCPSACGSALDQAKRHRRAAENQAGWVCLLVGSVLDSVSAVGVSHGRQVEAMAKGAPLESRPSIIDTESSPHHCPRPGRMAECRCPLRPVRQARFLKRRFRPWPLLKTAIKLPEAGAGVASITAMAPINCPQKAWPN